MQLFWIPVVKTLRKIKKCISLRNKIMLMHLQIYTFAYSYFSEDNTFFKKSLFDFIFSKKSQQDKSVLILQVKRAFTF